MNDPNNAVIENMFFKTKKYIDENIHLVSAHYEVDGQKSKFEIDLTKLANKEEKIGDIELEVYRHGDSLYKIIFKNGEIQYCKERMSIKEIEEEVKEIIQNLS